MKVQVYRTAASSYQNSQFLSKEKKILEEIPGVKYIQSLKDIERDYPFILITNTHTNPEEISKLVLDNTLLVIHPNSGHDNFKREFVKESPFPIVLGHPIRANAVVEYTLSCLFHNFTAIDNHSHWSTNRIWNRKLLRDQKALIIGHGHIGKILTQSLMPLCREVKVYDPHVPSSAFEGTLLSEYSEEMFDGVSILIMASDLNPTSKHMINSKVLKRLNTQNIIINPARGDLIVEDDLIKYLQKNPKSSCYLDVFSKEPFNPGYLNELKNVNKTSHIAGVFDRLNNDIISFEYIVINDFLNHYNSNALENFHSEYRECLLTEQRYHNELK